MDEEIVVNVGAFFQGKCRFKQFKYFVLTRSHACPAPISKLINNAVINHHGKAKPRPKTHKHTNILTNIIILKNILKLLFFFGEQSRSPSFQLILSDVLVSQKASSLCYINIIIITHYPFTCDTPDDSITEF